jgi:hypothetical protein
MAGKIDRGNSIRPAAEERLRGWESWGKKGQKLRKGKILAFSASATCLEHMRYAALFIQSRM